MKQITFIIFLILLTIKVSESVTCVNPEGKAVKWWIHLADADSASQDNMYARGLYYDNLLDLMKKHVDQANGPTITDQQFKDKKYLGLEWYHDQGNEYRVIDKSVFYHGHVKSLYVYDLRDDDATKNTGFFVSHSMRMPDLKSSTDGLYEKASGVQPSQHNTKAVFVRSKDNRRYFQPELTLKAPLDQCDKQWGQYVHSDRFRDWNNADGDLILKKLFTNTDSYTITKKYCMENGGPFTLGSFETFSFYARLKTPCNSHDKTTAFFKASIQDNDMKNEKVFSKCFALNYGKEITDYTKFENNHFKKYGWFEDENPIKVEMLSNTHCFRKDIPKDDSICYEGKRVCSFTDFGMDPYLLVAQHYESNFFVSTDQEGFPSLIGTTFSIRNIVTWSPLWSGEKGKDGSLGESRSRHEKLMVSKSKNIICLGDSNRNDYSVHHAGTIFCIKSEILAKKVHQSIGSFNLYRQFNFGNIKRKGLNYSPFESTKPVCYLYAQSLYHPIAEVSVDMKFFERIGSTPLTNSLITPGEPSIDQIESEKIKQALEGLKHGQLHTRQHTKHIKVDEEYAKKRAFEDPISQQLKKKRK
ncbi:hypothetical protein PPL_05388 [Heterostelium album PN500]|uniref:Uncharacterized protein n=1 Tax=Heterostelium pallidum (strain ATCC 26659 / Pp 5 / PN500) TaxID=670386 RepID=D3BA16_HETP5|nr:hypothetical protein PPL_05388 [Heterostelium album PN500]EFA81403.1 hypothetical protein PPL_05388 [Heterostelium album PN500]|eukprot:XP_020433521.1 hypothetical protein PPL_05388 [Heterostelium album PN500]